MPPRPHDPWRELPPTAGLPLGWRDLLAGWRTGRGFANAIADMLDFEAPPLVTCSGTAALVVALTTLRRHSTRRQVIVPGFTCPLVAIAIAHCGLQPVACDLTPGGIDLEETELVRLIGPDTLAVMPTHLAGRVTRLEPALRLAARHGAFIIEDAAQALGAHIGTRLAGTIGDIGFHSLAVGKGLSLYEGGLLHARDPAMRAELARTAGELLPANRVLEWQRSLELAAYTLLYRPRLLPLAYGRALRRHLRRGDILTAAGDRFGRTIPMHGVGRWRQGVGEHALARLPAFLAGGRQRADLILSRLSRVPGLTVQGDPEGTDGIWPSFLLRMPDAASCDLALGSLWGAGLGVSRLFVHALPDYPFLADILPDTPLPQARRLARTSLLLGNSPWLTNADLDVIVTTLATSIQHTT